MKIDTLPEAPEIQSEVVFGLKSYGNVAELVLRGEPIGRPLSAGPIITTRLTAVLFRSLDARENRLVYIRLV